MVKSNNNKTSTQNLKGAFMNTLYYELKHTKKYNQLVLLVDQSYRNNTSIRTLWKRIKSCKKHFKSSQAYHRLRRMVLCHLKENKNNFKYLIDDESYCNDKDVAENEEEDIDEYDCNDGFLVEDSDEKASNPAFYWRFN
jgi:hypothetical protein